MYSAGHDGVAFLSDSRNCRMYNCDVQVQTNSGVRMDNSDNCQVDHNTFTGRAGSGWCCVQLQNSLINANIHHNIMHDFRGSSRSAAGMGNVRASGSIHVHNNVMWNVSPYIEIGSGPGNILESHPITTSRIGWREDMDMALSNHPLLQQMIQ